MKILFLADNFLPERNAQASRVYERACYWTGWGHEVTVITCAPNFPDGKVYPGYKNCWRQTEELSGIRVVRVKTFIAANSGRMLRILDFLSYMVTSFYAGLFETRPDLIVATSPQFFAAVAGWSLSAVRNVSFVFELSDLWPDSIVAVGAMKRNIALRWLEKLELFLYARASAVVALTGAFKDNLVRRGISSEKITVVTNGVDLSRYRPRPTDHALTTEWGIGPEDFVIGYIGTHGMAHALDNVLDTAGLLANTNIRFLLIGAGAERERLVVESQRRALKNVIFVPPQEKSTIPRFWSICNAALVHLKADPLFKTVIPSKIFEAMGMGIPIVLASPEGEASRIVTREGVGLWVQPQDPKALSQAVLLLSQNRELLARFAEASRLAAPRHSRERQAKDMLSVFESVLLSSETITA